MRERDLQVIRGLPKRDLSAIVKVVEDARVLPLEALPAAFDREQKAGRCCFEPSLVTGWELQRIKRAIDFHGIECVRGEFELSILRQIVRIKFSAPAGITPARDANS